MEKEYYSIIRLPDVSEAVCEMRKLFPADVSCPVQDFGSNGKGEFPCSPALDNITLHPLLLAKARELLKTSHIRLVQSVAWAKYGVPSSGEQSNNDQRMHMDYGNNCYGMPLPSEPLQAVSMIVYYSNTRVTGGGTAVVPRSGNHDPVYEWPYVHMPGLCGVPFRNDRNSAEKLMSLDPVATKIRQSCYERELRPEFSPGDVLIYRLNTWHRGTPVHPGQVRYTHNLIFKRTDNTEIQVWNRGFTQKMYSGHFERFIGTLAPEQIETLGIPARNSSKWKSTKFCEAIRLRYGWAGFDLDNYVKTGQFPPPVPDYWPFSKFTSSGPSGIELRRNLFAKMSEENVHISLRASDWRYCLEFVEGDHYLKIDCRFFQREHDAIADINLLSGDRWVWGRLVRRLKSEHFKTLPHENVLTEKVTPPQIRKALDNGNYCEEYIYMMAPDIPDKYFLPFLSGSSLNIVRIASSRLKSVHDTPSMRFWQQRKPRNFLEKEITKNIAALCPNDSRL